MSKVIVYVAARFPDREDARRVRAYLESTGRIDCTSRWLDEPDGWFDSVTDAERDLVAAMDAYDVRRAQALVLLNPSDRAKVGTGGCHTEVGMALALGMPVFIFGERTNIFHRLSNVEAFKELDVLATTLLAKVRRFDGFGGGS